MPRNVVWETGSFLHPHLMTGSLRECFGQRGDWANDKQTCKAWFSLTLDYWLLWQDVDVLFGEISCCPKANLLRHINFCCSWIFLDGREYNSSLYVKTVVQYCRLQRNFKLLFEVSNKQWYTKDSSSVQENAWHWRLKVSWFCGCHQGDLANLSCRLEGSVSRKGRLPNNWSGACCSL